MVDNNRLYSDFCGFSAVAINNVDKLQFFNISLF